ncbi:hypothetical protein [Hymenobacter pini]|uniref:hypothetical protein n=1 Tax=Hymenobacter pini TaxID=2880879 RepID=UPI001CF16387|nr:hypothetical protein [Hymenobacter pini]MCA8831084.1 hypothetical protein [Hymenobacter pini]
MPRGYTLIEIDIPQEWDFDLIVKCHEIVRQAFPEILPEGAPTLEYDLIAVSSPHNPGLGPHYPAIGIYCPDKLAQDSIASIPFFDIYDRADAWISQLGLEELKARASRVEAVSWEWLKVNKVYPVRN